jgi:glycosyltransferase involved in cell wall biosynthesis
MTPTDASAAAPIRVTMLVRNRFEHDTRVEKEARSLTGAGHAVTVVAEAGDGLAMTEERDGYAVVRVARVGSRLPLLRFLATSRAFEHALAATRPQILHAHDSNALSAVGRVAGRVGAPFVYDAHDLWTGRAPHGRSRAYLAASDAYFRGVEGRWIPRAAARITVSGPLARHLEQAYRVPPFALVPNYPELSAGMVGRAARDLRALPGAEGIAAGAQLVLYLGGLMAGRGLEQLVDAMALLADEHPNAQLVMLGDGVLSDPLRARARAAGIGHRVHLIPPVPPAEVIDFAASADVGVSPIIGSCLNYRYSLPNKLFQTMAAGIPTVASDFPQVRDVVEASGAGVCVDTEEPSAVARAVATLLDDPARAREMGERGRQAVQQRFNWSVAETALLAEYQRIARSITRTGNRAPLQSRP